jgi:hypothetical protein
MGAAVAASVASGGRGFSGLGGSMGATHSGYGRPQRRRCDLTILHPRHVLRCRTSLRSPEGREAGGVLEKQRHEPTFVIIGVEQRER